MKYLVILLVMMVSTPAFAQGTKTLDTEEGYGYEFSDDPLNAGGFGPNDSSLVVRLGPVRSLLIRPRLSFVNELLKSVESL